MKIKILLKKRITLKKKKNSLKNVFKKEYSFCKEKSSEILKNILLTNKDT